MPIFSLSEPQHDDYLLLIGKAWLPNRQGVVACKARRGCLLMPSRQSRAAAHCLSGKVGSLPID